MRNIEYRIKKKAKAKSDWKTSYLKNLIIFLILLQTKTQTLSLQIKNMTTRFIQKKSKNKVTFQFIQCLLKN